jgi:DNA mismatch endonuclease (patch repair protein)
MDTLSPAQRSERMARVRSKDTRPEMIVRRTAHAMGYRYRLHDRRVPGSPDMVFRRRRKVIFVHGCFWHGHDCKLGARPPKSRIEFWSTKIAGNRRRDERTLEELQKAGWQSLVIWECQLGKKEWLLRILGAYLDA